MTARAVRSQISRLNAALLAGIVAIGVNTALLAAAEAIGIRTAHGGLLRLLQIVAAPPAELAGFGRWWRTTLLPATSGTGFQFAFHILVGILMAITYAFVAEPRLPGLPWVKGLACAVLVWLLNSFALLPLIGEGLAGSRHLTPAGIACFAAAHTVFFVLLAVLYDRIKQMHPRCR